MKIIIVSLFIFFTNLTFASNDLWLQGRVFIANTSIKPESLNTILKSDSLKTVDKTFNYGVEITFPVSRFLEPGMRYTHRTITSDEDPSNTQTTYSLDGKQDSILFLARILIIKSPVFRWDIFGGIGGSNTTLKYSSASHNGEYSKSKVADWYATPYYSFGSSFGIGFNSILLFGESGYESNKVKSFTTTGNVTSLSELNMSGTYFMIGIMFDGVKGYKK